MVRKNMTNNEIYAIAIQLVEHITKIDLSLPVKVNFYLQKNVTAVVNAATELERTRNEILQKYGTLDPETGNYSFEDNKVDQANAELMELFECEQEIPVYMISLDAFGDTELTTQQVQAISFMIEEEEEEGE